MRLYAPKKEMHYKYLDKIDRLEVEIVHILVIITAVTQNHGNCRKSRHKAKITVITAIVNLCQYVGHYANCNKGLHSDILIDKYYTDIVSCITDSSRNYTR